MNAYSWLYVFWGRKFCAFVFGQHFFSLSLGRKFLVLLPPWTTSEADSDWDSESDPFRSKCVVIVVATSSALSLCSRVPHLAFVLRNYHLNAFALSVLFDMFIR